MEYRVFFHYDGDITVEADSEDEAEDITYEMLEDMDYEEVKAILGDVYIDYVDAYEEA